VRRHLVPLVALAVTAAGAVALWAASPSVALTAPIDLRAEHDGPQSVGARVLERTAVTAGPGAELDAGDEVDNPSQFTGNVTVDVDPDARTITVATEAVDCYATVLVEIATGEIEAVTNISDTLLGGPATRSEDVSGGVVSLLWDSDAPCEDLVDGGEAVFVYGAPEPEEPVLGTASLDPTQVAAGEPVTVTGDECYDGVVLLDVVPTGGTLEDLVHSAEIPTGADGTWAHDIDTTGFAPGTYDVDPIECIEPETDNNRDVYNYEPLGFEVVEARTGPGVTAPTPTTDPPAPPAGPGSSPAAQPVVAAPTYTG
jgi:hypothetical protein